MSKLHYYLRSPASGAIQEHSAESVQNLLADTTKPVIFSCLGRDGFSGKTKPGKQVACVEGFFDDHPPNECHVIAITSSDRLTDTQLTNYMHSFNAKKAPVDYWQEYDHPTTFGMMVMKEVIEPLIPYAGYTSEAEHSSLFEQAKLKLSQLNFFSHSFGAVVVAEALDFMRPMLENKGYTSAEADEAMRCMGKLSIGHPFHITESRCHVPGIDLNSALDRITEKHGNVPKNSDSRVLAMDRIGDCLQLCPLTGETSVPYVSVVANQHADDQERRSFTSRIRTPDQPPRPSPWDMVVGDISDPQGHALQLYMYKDRTRTDQERGIRSTGQAYPGAELANRFMLELFETSAAATRTRTPRNTARIVEAMQAELAPPAVRDALADTLFASRAEFERHFHR